MARKTRRRPAAKRRVSAKPRRKVYAKRRRPRVNPANPTRRTYKRRRKARRNPDIPIAEIAIGLTVVAAVKAGVDYAAKKYPTMPGIAKKLAPAIAGAGGAFIMKKKKALALTMLAGGAAVTVDELVRPMINGGLSLTGKEMQDAGLPTQGMSQVQEFTEADVDRMRLSALVTSEVFSPGMGALQEAGQLAALQEAGQLAALQEAGQLAALQEAGQLGALQETAGISQYELNQVSLSPYDLNQYQLNQAKRRSLGADSV
ncbi:hypothetical protein JW935_05955 [candidate division KSB1 bacterium]|nr:hypothetical protein [candidate division KSB1 bacterium]